MIRLFMDRNKVLHLAPVPPFPGRSPFCLFDHFKNSLRQNVRSLVKIATFITDARGEKERKEAREGERKKKKYGEDGEFTFALCIRNRYLCAYIFSVSTREEIYYDWLSSRHAESPRSRTPNTELYRRDRLNVSPERGGGAETSAVNQSRKLSCSELLLY